MRGNRYLIMLAENSPEYSRYVKTIEHFPREQISSSFGMRHAEYLNTEAWMTLIFLTCTYLAAKVLESVPYHNLLSTMMGHVYQCDEVPSYLATELEIEILQALDWRLGPVFSTSE